ncbi:MAG TPA: hypothetical protein VNY34_00450 [Solirubrobacteraceae bacterium]|nr:hypothetical protein [Solirubrobacteraceae bacterium]
MTDFLNSVKADLLDRRLLPVLLVLGVALSAALAYAVLGGGSAARSTPTAAVSSPGASSGSPGAPISQAPANPNQPVAETTSGTSHQRGGVTRNPFTPLPGVKTASSSAKSTGASKTSGTSTTSSSGSSTKGAGGTTPATPKETTPAKPKKVYIHYHVTAQFGAVPPTVEGTPPQAAQLKTYKDMVLDEPLPGKANPQLVYLGVVLSTGKDVVFALTGEAILHGSATCKPSPTQCQAIELRVGQTETLEVVEPSGKLVIYELKLVSITKSVSTASTARAHTASKAGRELLRRDGVHSLSELHYSPEQGGLVFAGHSAFGARAHASVRHSDRG